MASRVPLVIVTRKLPEPVEARMADLFTVELNHSDTPFAQDQLVDAMARADVLVPTITDQLDAQILSTAGDQLRLIAQFGNGVDNIDLAAARHKAITVTNTPSVLTDDTADMTMAMILALPRRLIEGSAVVLNDGVWQGWSPSWMLGRRLGGKSLGIVGLGRIGQAVAKRAKAFGLDLHYVSRVRKPAELERALGVTYWPSLEEMLGQIDMLTLHSPYTEATYHLLNADSLALMREGAYVVNFARQDLIDEEALIAQIEQGHLAGAALDVFGHEGGINPRLLALARDNKVILSAHRGSATLEARVEMGERVIINIKVMFDGHSPPDRVLVD